jgi:hypothetical protein
MEPASPRLEVSGRRHRIELQGRSAKLLLYVVLAPIVCVPAACAFFAYAEGGTSLLGAVGFSAAIYVGFGLFLCWDSVRLRRRR